MTRTYTVAAALALAAAAQAQVVPTTTFIGTLRESFEAVPGYACPPCGYECLSIFNDAALICDGSSNSGLSIAAQGNGQCQTGPHTGVSLLVNTSNVTTIEFNFPVHKFSGWFADSGSGGGAKFEFLGAQGQLIGEVDVSLPACEWRWYGWESSPDFQTIRITGPNTLVFDRFDAESAGGCYPDCNGSLQLTISDFACFQVAFTQNNMYADCDYSGTLSISDFACFQNAFTAGCP